jgi:D-aminopeptidase
MRSLQRGLRLCAMSVSASPGRLTPHGVGLAICVALGRILIGSGNNSGDIFIALSTANPILRAELRSGVHDFSFLADEMFDPYYLAAVEATEEAVLNAMLVARDFTTLKPAGKTCRALDADLLLDALDRAPKPVSQQRKSQL